MYKTRYASYRRFSALYYGIFFTAMLLGAVIGTKWLATRSGGEAFDRFLSGIASSKDAGVFERALFPAALVSAAMLSGITVYAPFCGGVSVFLLGMEFGRSVRFYAEALTYTDFSAVFVCDGAYYICCGVILSLYCAFASCVASGLFLRRSGDAGERMFGGTLFYSEYYKKTVNLRFLAMYIAVYTASLGALFALSFLYSRVIGIMNI